MKKQQKKWKKRQTDRQGPVKPAGKRRWRVTDVVRALLEEQGISLQGGSSEAQWALRVIDVCKERGPMRFANLATDWCWYSLPHLFGVEIVVTPADVDRLADVIVSAASRMNVPKRAAPSRRGE